MVVSLSLPTPDVDHLFNLGFSNDFFLKKKTFPFFLLGRRVQTAHEGACAVPTPYESEVRFVVV